MKSKRIRDIDLQRDDWQSSIFLTFDLDWAADFVISDTLDLLEKKDVQATFFVTHESPILTRIRQNPKFEMGIHPNFNNLLASTRNLAENSTEIVEQLKEIVPESISMRSHSTTNSSRILEIAKQHGIIYECNYLIPYQSEIVLKPWLLWNEMIRCPYFFEDDVSMEYGLIEESMSSLSQSKGLKIFDFHPIHVFLNTDSLDLYQRSKSFQHNPESLMKMKNQQVGTRNKLLELLDMIDD